MKFTAATAALLDSAVLSGDIDGWTPAKVQSHENYASHFAGIPAGTFRSRLLRIRKKYKKDRNSLSCK